MSSNGEIVPRPGFSLKNSLAAIIAGYLTESLVNMIFISGFLLWYWAIFGNATRPPSFVVPIFPSIAGGFVTSFVAVRFRMLHSIITYLIGISIAVLMLPILAGRIPDFYERLKDSGISDVSPGQFDSIYGVVNYLSDAEFISTALLGITFYVFGSLLVYLLAYFTKVRAKNNKRTVPLILGVVGFLIMFVGLIAYSIISLFLLVFGVIQLFTPSVLIPIVMLGAGIALLKYANGFWYFAGWLVIVQTLIREFFNMTEALTDTKIPLLIIFSLALLIAFGSSFVYRYGRRIFSLSRMSPGSPELLILRSFGDDRTTMFGLWRKLLRWLTLREASMVRDFYRWSHKVFDNVGLVSNPKSELPSWAGSWLHLDNKSWQENVLRMIDNSEIIIMIVGSSYGLLTELQMISQCDAAKKTIYVFPRSFDLGDLMDFRNTAEEVGLELGKVFPIDEELESSLVRSDGWFDFDSYWDDLDNGTYLAVLDGSSFSTGSVEGKSDFVDFLRWFKTKTVFVPEN